MGPLYDVATVLPYDQSPGHKSAMRIGSTWDTGKVSQKDWTTVATYLGIPADEAIGRVTRMRSAIPEAFHGAAQDAHIPDSLRARATHIADLVTAHIESRRGAFGVLEPHRRA